MAAVPDSGVPALLKAAEAVLDEPALRRLRSSLTDLPRDPAAVRYQRLVEALDELARSAGAGVLLSDDAVVLARMNAAAEVLQAAGVEVQPCPGRPEQLLGRAVRWHRYARTPVPALLRACAADIARGSMRLWSAAGGRPGGLSPAVASRRQLQLARVQLHVQARAICSQLQAELGREAVALTPRGIARFGDRLRAEVLRAAADLDHAVSRRMTELGLPADAVEAGQIEDCMPPRRNCGLESRLTIVLGAGFGAGIAVTGARIATGLGPDWTAVAATVSGLVGLAATGWVVLARHLLIERAAAERRVAETAANLRTAFEERVISRIMTAEAGIMTAEAGIMVAEAGITAAETAGRAGCGGEVDGDAGRSSGITST